MLDSKHPGLSLTRQCNLLDINRSSVYYKHRPIRLQDLEIMKLIDEQYMKTPVYGTRSMRDYLNKHQGYKVNRKRVQRLMRLMGLEAIYPKPRTSKAHPGHRIYPYLLKGLDINRPDMVWATDITYIPLRRGFMYLVAVMDWHSRKVLSWRVSNTLDADFCVSALQEAIARYGCPEIFNTDQGNQFTSEAFTNVLKSNGIKISMDGRGRCMDNIFIERLWWTVKYHYLHLHSFENGLDLRKGLRSWFEYYNRERTHQSLNKMTPDECYFKEQIKRAA
jgi:putative transposase